MKLPKFKLAIFLSVLIFTLNMESVYSQASRFQIKAFESSDGEKLNYRLLVPNTDSLSKFPLIIFLHGSGEWGNYNES